MPTDAAPRPLASRVRRVIVAVIVVSFGLAALGGIAVLLGAELGELAMKVLATTATVGLFSVAVLCCAALLGRRAQLFGFSGVGVAVVTAVLVLLLIWTESGGDAFFRWLGTFVAATGAFALASLLLLLADRRRRVLRAGLTVTLVLIGLVFVLVVNLVWDGVGVDSEVYARVLGIIAILATLGTVVLPVMSLLLRDGQASATDAVIAPELAARLVAEAARRGISVEQLVAPVLASPRESAGR